MTAFIPLAIYLATMIFAAGGAWFALKEAQRHVNGVGAKLNALEKERQDRHLRLVLALVSLAGNDTERKALIEKLVGD